MVEEVIDAVLKEHWNGNLSSEAERKIIIADIMDRLNDSGRLVTNHCMDCDELTTREVCVSCAEG